MAQAAVTLAHATQVEPRSTTACAGAGTPRGLPPVAQPERALKFVIAPLVPVVAAIAAGIMVDRLVEPLATRAWVTIALAAGIIAAATVRRGLVSAVAIVVSLFALGGGWHHYRWSDLSPDDLAPRVNETPRPAWVRGVVRETLGLRHQAPGYGFGRSESDRVVTRFVLDLTAVSDGTNWQPASGRALVIVGGDSSAILAGTAVEVTGQLAGVAAPLNPGEFDYRAFLRGQGIRLRLSVDGPASVWPDPTQRAGRSLVLWGGCARGAARGWSSGSTPRPHRWRPPCFWASARRSSPMSTTPSHGRAPLTYSPFRAFSSRRWPWRSCLSFGLWACRAGPLISAWPWRWSPTRSSSDWPLR